ncbi:recombinase family protein [Bacillus salinus]|uniref:recombinase family protein n=1 Tax=Bacillus sp. HMF5848 TaxID=2495421 RepID=UPI00163A7996|nr:recombinase family protein [Bacillus sp. HMF5848]
MNFEHKYVYLVNDMFLVTDRPRPKYKEDTLPFNIYKDTIKVLTGYVRWSDDSQTLGHSLEIQESVILSRAKLEGYQVVVLFIDEATSAYHTPAQKRKVMLDMKHYALSNSNVTAVIFYEESRVTRLIEDFVLNILGPIKSARPNFIVYSTQIDGEWDENNPYVQAKLAYAHEEVVNKSQRGYDYHKSIIKNSFNPQRPGSRNPFGYDKTTLKDDDIETNEYSVLVIFIFYLYSFGYSDKKIANLLDKASIPPPSVDAKGWSDSSIRYILTNRWYIGDLAWFSRTSYHISKKKPINEIELFQNHHEALIGPNLWNVTQFFRKFKQEKDRMDSPFILRHIVFCETCGKKLVAKNATPAKSSKKYNYYRCPDCKKKIPMEDLHQITINDFSSRWARELSHYIDKAKKILNAWKSSLNANLIDLTKQLETLKYDLSMLKENHQYYPDLKESFELQIDNIKNQQLHYRAVREEIDYQLKDPMLYELLDRFKQDISSYTFEEQRSLLLLSIEKITIEFDANNHTRIVYRLTPFVDVENVINSLDDKSA